MSYSRANNAEQPSDSDGGSSYQKASTQDSSPQNSASQSLHRNGNGNGSSNGSSTWSGYSTPPEGPPVQWPGIIDLRKGRVLVVDFTTSDPQNGSKSRRRGIQVREHTNLSGLERVCQDPPRPSPNVVRVFHVQNAPWATNFLIKKFGIDQTSEIVGNDFAPWARARRAERRGGRPYPRAHSWDVKHDTWRSIAKTSFAIDYLATQQVDGVNPLCEQGEAEKVMELSHYAEHNNRPTYGHDVYLQRLCCYIQLKAPKSEDPMESVNGVPSPYQQDTSGHVEGQERDQNFLDFSKINNGNAIIIFDDSQTCSSADCLMPSRKEGEDHWCHLPFSVKWEMGVQAEATDKELTMACARVVLNDIFKALTSSWQGFLRLGQVHIAILEDKVYERPNDETHAAELWSNSAHWLKVEKVATHHTRVVAEMQVYLHSCASKAIRNGNGNGSGNGNGNGNGDGNGEVSAPKAKGGPPVPNISGGSPPSKSNGQKVEEPVWLQGIPRLMDQIQTDVEEDLMKPTQNLIQLLYQSVSIRDSRHSLTLGHSLWRLSWITFIFLPLTFLSGFFGMNVTTFKNDPSIKWYAVAAGPLMAVLIAVVWTFRKFSRNKMTMRVWESFFTDLSVANPRQWTRGGPRTDISGTLKGHAKWKWRFIQRWSRPETTINAAVYGENAADELSVSEKLKRYLIRRWTKEIATQMSVSHDDEEALLGQDEDSDTGIYVADANHGAIALVALQGAPHAAVAFDAGLRRSQSSTQSGLFSPAHVLDAAVRTLSQYQGRRNEGGAIAMYSLKKRILSSLSNRSSKPTHGISKKPLLMQSRTDPAAAAEIEQWWLNQLVAAVG